MDFLYTGLGPSVTPFAGEEADGGGEIGKGKRLVSALLVLRGLSVQWSKEKKAPPIIILPGSWTPPNLTTYYYYLNHNYDFSQPARNIISPPNHIALSIL